MNNWRCDFCSWLNPEDKNDCEICNRKREDSVAEGRATPTEMPVPGTPESVETRLTKRSLKAFALGLVVAILGFVPAALADKSFGGGFSLQIHSPEGFFLELVSFLFLFGILALLTGPIVRGLRAMKSLWRALWWVIPVLYLALFLYLALLLLALASAFGGEVLSFVVRVVLGVGLDYSGDFASPFAGFVSIVVVWTIGLMVRRELRREAKTNQAEKTDSDLHSAATEERSDPSNNAESTLDAGPGQSGTPPRPWASAAPLETRQVELLLPARVHSIYRSFAWAGRMVASFAHSANVRITARDGRYGSIVRRGFRSAADTISPFVARAVASLAVVKERVWTPSGVASLVAAAVLLALFLTVDEDYLWLAMAIVFCVLVWRYTRNRKDSVAAGKAAPTAVAVSGTSELVENRLTQRSLKAFVFGLAGVIPAYFLISGATLIVEHHSRNVWEWGWVELVGLPLSLGLLAAIVASLLVSVVWGLRVVKSRWHVLWWVIPAGLLVGLFGMATLGLVFLIAGPMVFWVLRREAKRNQTGKADAG